MQVRIQLRILIDFKSGSRTDDLSEPTNLADHAAAAVTILAFTYTSSPHTSQAPGAHRPPPTSQLGEMGDIAPGGMARLMALDTTSSGFWVQAVDKETKLHHVRRISPPPCRVRRQRIRQAAEAGEPESTAGGR